MELTYAMVLCNMHKATIPAEAKLAAARDMVTDPRYDRALDKSDVWQVFRWCWEYLTGKALPDGLPYACYTGMTREAMRALMRVLLYDEEDGHGQET